MSRAVFGISPPPPAPEKGKKRAPTQTKEDIIRDGEAKRKAYFQKKYETKGSSSNTSGTIPCRDCRGATRGERGPTWAPLWQYGHPPTGQVPMNLKSAGSLLAMRCPECYDRYMALLREEARRKDYRHVPPPWQTDVKIVVVPTIRCQDCGCAVSTRGNRAADPSNAEDLLPLGVRGPWASSLAHGIRCQPCLDAAMLALA